MYGFTDFKCILFLSTEDVQSCLLLWNTLYFTQWRSSGSRWQSPPPNCRQTTLEIVHSWEKNKVHCLVILVLCRQMYRQEMFVPYSENSGYATDVSRQIGFQHNPKKMPKKVRYALGLPCTPITHQHRYSFLPLDVLNTKKVVNREFWVALSVLAHCLFAFIMSIADN